CTLGGKEASASFQNNVVMVFLWVANGDLPRGAESVRRTFLAGTEAPATIISFSWRPAAAKRRPMASACARFAARSIARISASVGKRRYSPWALSSVIGSVLAEDLCQRHSDFCATSDYSL